MKRAAQSLGRLGGLAKSAAKAAAAKENGKRGGRPRKRNPLTLAGEFVNAAPVYAEVLRLRAEKGVL